MPTFFAYTSSIWKQEKAWGIKKNSF